MQETWVFSLVWEDPVKEEMATHSSILAWEILWTEEPGGLQSLGVTVGHNLVTKQQQQYFTMHMYKKPLVSCVHLSGSVCGEGVQTCGATVRPGLQIQWWWRCAVSGGAITIKSLYCSCVCKHRRVIQLLRKC